ncbi:MAG: peptide chain release factor N(5)-glutamine methyltransferase [Bacteroidales bacterium]|nr:peptide chain release factor N(5)-glutamine methyltransferase [Bacteroidales bacterium]
MRIPSNRLKSVLNFAKTELKPLFDEKEILSFFYLLCEHYLKMDKTSVILNPDYALSESELLKFNFAIKDLKTEKPIQYILGRTEFFGYNFKVNEHTLIPRPETEELVQWIIDNEKPHSQSKILDIGTGSGCIAISLAKQLSKAIVSGIDISTEALKIAEINNRELNAGLSLDLIDILNPPKFFDTKFDIIVSNPPYVLEAEKTFMKKNVLQYEPNQALFVKDNDPLIFYRKILSFTKTHLVSGGRIYFEINEQKGDEMLSLLKAFNYHKIELKKDLFNRPRMIYAIKD